MFVDDVPHLLLGQHGNGIAKLTATIQSPIDQPAQRDDASDVHFSLLHDSFNRFRKVNYYNLFERRSGAGFQEVKNRQTKRTQQLHQRLFGVPDNL